LKKTNWMICVILLAAGVISASAQAVEKKTVASVLDRALSGVEAEVVPAAEAMPEDKYSFAPTNGEFKGVRTYAQQIKHLAAVNYMLGAAILGEKPPVELGGESGPDTVKSKAEILKFFKESFAYMHKAVQTVTPENAVSDIPSPFGEGKTTRLGMATLAPSHLFDHYGQMVVYLRMNGIIPPASRQ
jgi:uncharacterized damage-inducible protein DinB